MRCTTERVLLASQTVQRNGTAIEATFCRERTVSRVVAGVAMAAATPNHFYNPHDEEEDTVHSEAVTVVRTPVRDSTESQHDQHGDDELLLVPQLNAESSSGACPHPVTPMRSRMQQTIPDDSPAHVQPWSSEVESNPIREPLTAVNNSGSDERLIADRSNGWLHDASADAGMGTNRPIQLSLERQLGEARQQIQQLKCEKEELVIVSRGRDEELRLLRECYETLIKVYNDRHQAERDGLLKKCEVLERELRIMKAKEEKQKRSIYRERTLLQQKDEELTKKAADLDRQEESVRAKQQNLSERERSVAEREQLETRLSSLTEREKKLTEDLMHCQETIVELETENASLRQKNTHLSLEIAQVREENTRLSAQLQNVEERLEKKMDNQHKELKGQLAEVKAELAAITKDGPPTITSHAHQESVLSQTQPSSASHTKPDHSPNLHLRQPVANKPQPSRVDCAAAAADSQQSPPDTVTASGYASKVDTMAVHRITRVWPGYEQYFRNQTPSLANVTAILNELRSLRGGLKDLHDNAESHYATAAAAAQPDISAALKEMEEVLSAAPTILTAIQLLRSSGGDIALQLRDIERNVKEVINELQGEKTTAALGDALLSCWSVTKLCKHL